MQKVGWKWFPTDLAQLTGLDQTPQTHLLFCLKLSRPLRSRNAISTHRIRHRFSSSVRTVKAPKPNLSLPLTAPTVHRGPTPFVGPPPVGHRNFPTTGVNVDMRASSTLTYTFIVRELCLRHHSISTPPLDITGSLTSSPFLPTPFLFVVSPVQECGFARFDHYYVTAASLLHYAVSNIDDSSQSRICGPPNLIFVAGTTMQECGLARSASYSIIILIEYQLMEMLLYMVASSTVPKEKEHIPGLVMNRRRSLDDRKERCGVSENRSVCGLGSNRREIAVKRE
ncbi:hypothetical protein YC2023_115407 [Brassica napus]